MKKIEYRDRNFYNKLKKHLSKRNQDTNQEIDISVKKILKKVQDFGDEALLKYTKKFDNFDLKINEILLSKKIRSSYKNKIDLKILDNFKHAIENVTKFHKEQIPKNYELKAYGSKLQSRWKAIESVGLYIPGGIAAYPSSLIMNVVPAKVAGVKRIVCTIPPSKLINPYILALFDELGVEEVYQIGGAQAIAALAYGTKTINPVNKIFGPGNSYVASAKKHVFGKVGIDLIAGPSEIVVIADEKNNSRWVASDLMAQAEHDINAQSILITNNSSFADKVLNNITNLIVNLPKKKIITKSLNKNGLIILVKNISDSIEIINSIAPEHLHIHTDKNGKFIENIHNAGCIFVGEYSSEAFGDYIIGTNHILPTFGTAKFSSGLNVLDFMKRNSIVEIDKDGFDKYENKVQQMAEIEGLDAHKLSVKIRQNK
ncbi:MAG: histidinol dehydrogenase [Rickettsiales bacterium]|nr:histidinol dehydrogenase [Rickettsiales bacterium]|tara:strand:- start:520 stop:1806 length:1287 start_codon:yes stop_codon:yes gene_type:complete